MTQRYKMIIEYKGTNYHGWQRQVDVPTIQEDIETAIYKFSGQTVTIYAAGRTDAGVHAGGQVIHADFEAFTKPMDGFLVAKAINAHLRPAPIAVIKAEAVDDEFNARFDATNKLYRYRIITRPAFLTHDRDLAWLCYRPLDIAAMQEGAQHLIGKHDFSSFRDAECQAKCPIRTLDRIDISVKPYDDHGGQEIYIEAEAQSFLHHQIRNITGTLRLVGEGKWRPEDVRTALEAKSRTKAGPTAPADGLSLVRIDY